MKFDPDVKQAYNNGTRNSCQFILAPYHYIFKNSIDSFIPLGKDKLKEVFMKHVSQCQCSLNRKGDKSNTQARR